MQDVCFLSSTWLQPSWRPSRCCVLRKCVGGLGRSQRAYLSIGNNVSRLSSATLASLVTTPPERAGESLFTDASSHALNAQIMNLNDIPRLRQLGIIPSVQPTHCTSDMGFVPDRRALLFLSLGATSSLPPCCLLFGAN